MASSRAEVQRGEHLEERGRECLDPTDDKEGSTRCSATYIECRLHPVTVESLLAAAPSGELSNAWRTGEAIPGKRNRIRLFPHTMAGNGRFAAEQGLYDEGREWWEES